MKKLFESANRYMKESDWKDLSLIKFCLCSAGVLIGIATPMRYKKIAGIAAGVIFTATYEPLMEKYFRILTEDEELKNEEE
jgi:hypothetical protein